MQYADIITRKVDSLPLEKQAEALDFIELLKVRQIRTGDASAAKTSEEIETFFRSFNVDISGFKFNREEAHVR